jgi:hypothetical protein
MVMFSPGIHFVESSPKPSLFSELFVLRDQVDELEQRLVPVEMHCEHNSMPHPGERPALQPHVLCARGRPEGTHVSVSPGFRCQG